MQLKKLKSSNSNLQDDTRVYTDCFSRVSRELRVTLKGKSATLCWHLPHSCKVVASTLQDSAQILHDTPYATVICRLETGVP